MEPWLSGTIPHQDPIIRAVLHSFEQVRQDLAKWTAGIPDSRVWESPHGIAPLGFQLRHIAGSVDRLVTYAKGDQLNDKQMAFLKREAEPGATLAELMTGVHESLARAESVIRIITNLSQQRAVGKKMLPTTVGGLLVHVAEHTQRHLGQAIVTCKLLK